MISTCNRSQPSLPIDGHTVVRGFPVQPGKDDLYSCNSLTPGHMASLGVPNILQVTMDI